MAKKDTRNRYSVLVTGGAGFLGQHIVAMLQTRADHVTEIRVLDMVPYTNQLPDYETRNPVKDFVGSINDVDLVDKACRNVNCVMHVASIVDNTLIPDMALSYRINVEGTVNVIEACKKNGVKRLIYCSSVDVVYGKGMITRDGREEDLVYPDKYLFHTYATTKMQAEKLVLEANSTGLSTVSLRPSILYGELEWRVYGVLCSNILATKFRKYVPLDSRQGLAEHVYVGNVAWGFVCADNKLRDINTTSDASGRCYFLADDSPRKSIYEFMQPIMKEIGMKPYSWSIPVPLILCILYVIYFILTVIRPFYRVNFPYGMAAFKALNRTATYSYNRARDELDYTPLFTYDEAKKKTAKFFREKYFK
ncbi:hypothetical protein ACF0H5_013748 [Mactra antiquata]